MPVYDAVRLKRHIVMKQIVLLKLLFPVHILINLYEKDLFFQYMFRVNARPNRVTTKIINGLNTPCVCCVYLYLALPLHGTFYHRLELSKPRGSVWTKSCTNLRVVIPYYIYYVYLKLIINNNCSC